ncbi:MAG: hypothetical protein K5870_07685 [Lachnospiraceae bacterium]|nr:hypothetical protein [Lachnospiraceae bacterium]
MESEHKAQNSFIPIPPDIEASKDRAQWLDLAGLFIVHIKIYDRLRGLKKRTEKRGFNGSSQEKMAAGPRKGEIMRVSNIVDEVGGRIFGEYNGFTGLKTGLRAIDCYGGLRDGDLILIAARPEMGKTDLLYEMIDEIAINRKRVCVFFDFDRGCESFVHNFLLHITKAEKYKGVDVDYPDEKEKLADAIEKLKHSELQVFECHAIEEIESECRELYESTGIDLIVLDVNDLRYIRHHDHTGKYGEIGVSDCLIRLKRLAKEMKCPVVITEELPKSVDEREDKRPSIDDLGYPELEDYPDFTILLYRNSYYSIDQLDDDRMEITIARNLRGRNGSETVIYDRKTGEYRNVQHE